MCIRSETRSSQAMTNLEHLEFQREDALVLRQGPGVPSSSALSESISSIIAADLSGVSYLPTSSDTSEPSAVPEEDESASRSVAVITSDRASAQTATTTQPAQPAPSISFIPHQPNTAHGISQTASIPLPTPSLSSLSETTTQTSPNTSTAYATSFNSQLISSHTRIVPE